MVKMTKSSGEVANRSVQIRTARPDDLRELLAVYAPYILGTTITFEETVPSVEEFRARIETTLERYPYLVAEEVLPAGESTRILGYAYAGAYSSRVAYDWSVETAIYVSREASGRGVGSALYRELERVLARQHVVNLGACITTENEGSLAFHRHLGYEKVAEFKHFGFKFGRWLDVTWMEKTLGELPAQPEPFVPFGELS
jgi:phosphinothricin acetyltransferase